MDTKQEEFAIQKARTRFVATCAVLAVILISLFCSMELIAMAGP
jgi:hypothetical protein